MSITSCEILSRPPLPVGTNIKLNPFDAPPKITKAAPSTKTREAKVTMTSHMETSRYILPCSDLETGSVSDDFIKLSLLPPPPPYSDVCTREVPCREGIIPLYNNGAADENIGADSRYCACYYGDSMESQVFTRDTTDQDRKLFKIGNNDLSNLFPITTEPYKVICDLKESRKQKTRTYPVLEMNPSFYSSLLSNLNPPPTRIGTNREFPASWVLSGRSAQSRGEQIGQCAGKDFDALCVNHIENESSAQPPSYEDCKARDWFDAIHFNLDKHEAFGPPPSYETVSKFNLVSKTEEQW
eukprot:CAMPEP_0195518648 /NCGR_PEP_ID=MMETSP0794_2-20130614/13408_1 /TAXON_ID=515487 /ORGANISM="Stephanopyxis turris, Strain CCMP 815" /LENGTH=297 /DNA_ID=CAMNT_0040647663 /DNA_START=262 /DNA_END=1152 /DNA_ORIENTATION=-